MPLKSLSYTDDPLCFGNSWKVADEGALARLVALLILGEHLRVRDIMSGLNRDSPAARRAFLDRQIESLTVPPGPSPARWHRDGWLFQMICWIGAHLLVRGTAYIRAPHSRKSDKGLDGLVVEMSGPTIGVLRICEDKATDDPRKTIRDKVWPELRDFENAEKDGEVVSEVGALLEPVLDEAMRRAILESVLWENPWTYRVSVTIETLQERKNRAALLKGYDLCVSGGLWARRDAELYILPQLRDWMDALSELVRSELEGLRSTADV